MKKTYVAPELTALMDEAKESIARDISTTYGDLEISAEDSMEF